MVATSPPRRAGPPRLRPAWPRPLSPLTGVTMAQLGGGFAGGAVAPYVVVLSAELDVPADSLGWLATSFGACLLLLSLTGDVVRRVGASRLLRLSGALGAVSAVVLAATPPLGVVAAASVSSGLAGSLGLVCATVLLRGSAARVSLAVGYASLASLLAPLAVGAVELAGVSGGWALALPAPMLALLAVLGVAPERSSPAVPSPASTAAETGGRPQARPDLVAVTAAWCAIVLAVAAEFCFAVWGVTRLADAGLSVGAAALVGAAFPLGMVVGRFAGARMRPVESAGGRQRLRLAAVVTAAATVAVVVGPTPAVVAVGLLVAGLALATTYPIGLSLLVSVPRLALTRATALGAAASGTAIVAAPLALGALASVVDLRLAFLLPLPLLALLLVALHPRWHPRPGSAASSVGDPT